MSPQEFPSLNLPAAYDAESEENKVLQKLKKKTAKSFSPTKAAGLSDSHDLAWYLYLFGRTQQALEVCTQVAMVEFTGNFNLWSPVERVLALQSRILKEFGRVNEAAVVLQRIKTAGFVQTRLEGTLLNDKKIRACKEDGDKTLEKSYRLSQGSELCFIKELGGSKVLPPDKAEAAFQDNLNELKLLIPV